MISKASSPVTLAHELGHALGLLDCFDAAGNGRGTPMLGRGECISKARFASARDWGRESGRGFYGKPDTVSSIIFTLLMSGIPNGAYGFGSDLPDGEVEGIRVDAATGGPGEMIPVGAVQIEPENGKVFSK